MLAVFCMKMIPRQILWPAVIGIFSMQSLIHLDIQNHLVYAPVVEIAGEEAAFTTASYGILKLCQLDPIPLLIGGTSQESLFLESCKFYCGHTEVQYIRFN